MTSKHSSSWSIITERGILPLMSENEHGFAQRGMDALYINGNDFSNAIVKAEKIARATVGPLSKSFNQLLSCMLVL